MAPVLTAAWCAFALAVVVGCPVPANWLPARLLNDKLLHFASYAVLALPIATVTSTLAQNAAGAVILLPASLAIEITQHFVPNAVILALFQMLLISSLPGNGKY